MSLRVNARSVSYRVKTIFLTVILLGCCFAQPKKYIREYTYEARTTDSKASSRYYALVHLQSILLEEVGVFVENREKLKLLNDEEWYKQEVTSLSASIDEVSVIEEKWDGETFWVKASVTVDDSKLQSQIDSHTDNSSQKNRIDKTNSAEESNRKTAEKLQRELDSVSVIPHVEPQRLAVTKREKQGAALWYNLAQHHEFMGDHDTSYVIFCYSSALDFNPFHSEALYRRGKLYLKQKEVFKALEDFSAAIVADSTMGLYYRERAELLFDLREYPDANRDFEKAIAMKTADSFTYFSYASSLSWSGNSKYAHEICDTMITLWPDKLAGQYQKGMIYYEEKSYKKALKQFDTLVKKESDNSSYHYMRGLTLEKMGKNRDALRSFERSLELNPNSRSAQEMISKLKQI